MSNESSNSYIIYHASTYLPHHNTKTITKHQCSFPNKIPIQLCDDTCKPCSIKCQRMSGPPIKYIIYDRLKSNFSNISLNLLAMSVSSGLLCLQFLQSTLSGKLSSVWSAIASLEQQCHDECHWLTSTCPNECHWLFNIASCEMCGHRNALAKQLR